MTRQTLIAIRRDTAANWTSADGSNTLILAAGEWGFETDTGRLKIGDGTTHWSILSYVNHLSLLKDVNLTDLADGQILQWQASSSKWINVTQSGGHTQNTDTGTTAASFDLDSDGTTNGVKLKTSSGELQLRNLTDAAYADLRVKNLTVEGTTTTIHSTDVAIDDNVIVLNSDVTGTPSENAGIEVERGSSANASILWDESADVWKVGLAGSETAISLSGHTHSYVGLITSPNAGNFATMDAEGGLLTSSYGPSSFALSGHNHDSAYVNLPAGMEKGDLIYYGTSSFTNLHHDAQYKVLISGAHDGTPSWADIDGGSA